jgi:hypothetical protein
LESDIEKIACDTAIKFLNKKYPSAHPLNWNLKLIDKRESDNVIAYQFTTHIPVLLSHVVVLYEKDTKSFHVY